MVDDKTPEIKKSAKSLMDSIDALQNHDLDEINSLNQQIAQFFNLTVGMGSQSEISKLVMAINKNITKKAKKLKLSYDPKVKMLNASTILTKPRPSERSASLRDQQSANLGYDITIGHQQTSNPPVKILYTDIAHVTEAQRLAQRIDEEVPRISKYLYERFGVVPAVREIRIEPIDVIAVYHDTSPEEPDYHTISVSLKAAQQDPDVLPNALAHEYFHSVDKGIGLLTREGLAMLVAEDYTKARKNSSLPIIEYIFKPIGEGAIISKTFENFQRNLASSKDEIDAGIAIDNDMGELCKANGLNWLDDAHIQGFVWVLHYLAIHDYDIKSTVSDALRKGTAKVEREVWETARDNPEKFDGLYALARIKSINR